MKLSAIGVLLSVLMVIVCLACASDPEPDPFVIEQRLVAAGFTYIVADTPDKQKRLQQLPQARLIEYLQEEDVIYLFADKAGCNCVYVGDETAYKRFLELTGEQAATDKRLKNTTRDSKSGVDTSSYYDSIGRGTWKPWW